MSLDWRRQRDRFWWVGEVLYGLGLLAGLTALITVPIASCVAYRKTEYKRQAPDKIRDVLSTQVDAWNRGDLEGFMAGYRNAPDITFYSGGTVTEGWQPVLDRYRKRYQADGKEMGNLTFSDIQVEALGSDAALVRGRWKVVTSKETFDGLFTLLVRRFDDGWKIVHDHTSAAEKPAVPAEK